ncbi:hypothetical protein B296_00019790 [Ensete ventricosum]|uniref:Uncharacterized protein n=1 Tax=Ensete ventricosum TaxID=4639 RepID=A0A427A9Y6_ENSVE|nr:hypothetical protein B296_00019790 [Ensete ventricosum]
MLAMSGGFQQGCGESSEEELSVLPRHTKVVVTGNNRTKSVLVGLQGVVKKAVGLGGWHWLVLTNGIEVKLQRNALSVIEAPTGHEEDDETECDNMQWNGSDIGKLTIGVCFSVVPLSIVILWVTLSGSLRKYLGVTNEELFSVVRAESRPEQARNKSIMEILASF